MRTLSFSLEMDEIQFRSIGGILSFRFRDYGEIVVSWAFLRREASTGTA